jgi:bifunctional DNA-binding transcriptional regulator/antitoxin component of YhaV-PrlF toxin-antitoxin module
MFYTGRKVQPSNIPTLMPRSRLNIKPIGRIKRKMQLTIPAVILRALKLDVGSFIEFSIKDGKLLLEPIRLPGENPEREAEMLAAFSRSRSQTHKIDDTGKKPPPTLRGLEFS